MSEGNTKSITIQTLEYLIPKPLPNLIDREFIYLNNVIYSNPLANLSKIEAKIWKKKKIKILLS